MKIKMISILLAFLAISLVGCDDDGNDTILIEDAVPASPQGIYSVTGDGMVFVVFNGIYDRDVKKYNIYASFFEASDYFYIGEVEADDNPNLDLIVYTYIDTDVDNGETYYYAVTAVDFAGQESDLSVESVSDTPRPEDEVVLFSTSHDPGRAGFDFALQAIVDTNLSDVYVDLFEGVLYLNAGGKPGTLIQDVGYTRPDTLPVPGGPELAFDDVTTAPLSGWSTNGFAEIIEGHTYIILTATGNFAKMRADLVSVEAGLVWFQWAYQTDVGNPELTPGFDGNPEQSSGLAGDVR